ncbi:hypothetical protein AB1Y20_007256 [Prymnesium parvum]|uniref:CAF17 C-terminal domain-containing protein n=1 Tax=Prymnesium parvum TaxID=97485 RepID=A0AB34IWM5_PRYPA|mmetsp:Transcript_22369/g.55636  ORF Transcript_22369/g.55636 Transcript_22369/m.55636 type:complete len:371 (+) Transcript_22369:3-1115(+)
MLALSRRLPALSSAVWHTSLPSRAVLELAGRDSRKLLQGLVTNDVEKLDEGPQFTAFLSAQGRVLYDAFLLNGKDGNVLIDVDRAVLSDMSVHLNRYKLRSKVVVRDVSHQYVVRVLCGSGLPGPAADSRRPCDGGAWADPRLPMLGYRFLQPVDDAVPMPEESVEASPVLHALQLALLGVPEGARGFPKGEEMPLENNLHALNGVSFKKGCYLGQELTARTHFRGVIRKRLLPVLDASLAESVSVALAENSLPSVPAFAHLPTYEHAIISAILSARETADSRHTGEALPVASEVSSDGMSLNDEKGKRTAQLRFFEPSLGVGLALCRLTAVKHEKLGQTLVTPRGDISLVPLRPDWWSDDMVPLSASEG